MFTSIRTKKFVLTFVVSLLMLTLTGCGSSAYLDAFNPAIEQFNSSVNTVNAQMDALIADNALFEDATWQSVTSTALSNWKGASEALTNLPEPEEEYAQLDSLVQEMASQSLLASDAYSAAIEAGDITLLNDSGPYLDRVNELLPQINAEVDRLNQ